MKDAVYFEVKKRIKSEKLAMLFTKIIYGCIIIKFILEKTFIKRERHNNFTEVEALRIIEDKLPFRESNPVLNNQPMDEDVKCSVIIPVYNHEDILERTINSVVGQNCKYGYEIILVDDGSNQETKEILKRYEKVNKCHVIYQENQGIAGARNTGLNHAVGQYVMFVDCDDNIREDMLENLLDAAFLNDSDIVIGGYQLVKECGGKVISRKEYIYPKELLCRKIDEDDIMALPGYPWGKIYKRTLFENLRFFTGYWYEDTIIQFLLYRKSKKFTYIPKVFYEYKWYEKNFSKTQNSKANIKGVQRYWMLLLMIEKSKELGLPEDITFYTTLLRHLGIYYYGNIKDFEENLKQAMFIAGSYLLKKYKPNKKYKLPLVLKTIEKALLNQDYELWQLSCKYQ